MKTRGNSRLTSLPQRRQQRVLGSLPDLLAQVSDAGGRVGHEREVRELRVLQQRLELIDEFRSSREVANVEGCAVYSV